MAAVDVAGGGRSYSSRGRGRGGGGRGVISTHPTDDNYITHKKGIKQLTSEKVTNSLALMTGKGCVSSYVVGVTEREGSSSHSKSVVATTRGGLGVGGGGRENLGMDSGGG